MVTRWATATIAVLAAILVAFWWWYTGPGAQARLEDQIVGMEYFYQKESPISDKKIIEEDNRWLPARERIHVSLSVQDDLFVNITSIWLSEYTKDASSDPNARWIERVTRFFLKGKKPLMYCHNASGRITDVRSTDRGNLAFRVYVTGQANTCKADFPCRTTMSGALACDLGGIGQFGPTFELVANR